MSLVLLAFAFVFAVCAAANASAPSRVNWLGLAFACYIGSLLFGNVARFLS